MDTEVSRKLNEQCDEICPDDGRIFGDNAIGWLDADSNAECSDWSVNNESGKETGTFYEDASTTDRSCPFVGI